MENVKDNLERMRVNRKKKSNNTVDIKDGLGQAGTEKQVSNSC